MNNFAVLDENLVVNIIIADSKETAELATNKTCIPFSQENPAFINGIFDGSRFISPKPYPSWILNDEFEWISTIQYPTDGKIYIWNEEKISWDEVEQK